MENNTVSNIDFTQLTVGQVAELATQQNMKPSEFWEKFIQPQFVKSPK